HQAGADAGTDGQEREVGHAPAGAAPLLAERGEIDVVLGEHRGVDEFADGGGDRDALQLGRAGQANGAGLRLDHAGHADDAADRVEAGREPVAHLADVGDDGLWPAVGQRQVAPGDDGAGEVGERGAQVPAADVHGQDVPDVVGRFKVDGAEVPIAG